MGDYFGHEDTRAIAVRRWMIEATRDPDGSANYAAALLLAQVTFWCEPSTRTGRPRAQHEHGGEIWLVRPDVEWMDELGMTERAARRARKRLESLGLVEARTLVDRGVRCTHLRRLPDATATADAEPSTIRPKAAVATGQNVHQLRPETADGPTVQADSHAPASPSSSREVGREVPADAEAPEGQDPKADRDPQLVRAEAITKAHWDRCHAEDVPRPTLKAKGNPWLAVRNIVRGFLDAGYSDEQLADALWHTQVFTIDGLTFTLRQRGARPTPRTAGPSRESWGESGVVHL